MDNNQTVEIMVQCIYENLPPAALFEQLAEECVELSKCALKQARLLRGENPTPVDSVELTKDLDEESADVLLCLDILGIHGSTNLMHAKLNRWVQRLAQKPDFKPVGLNKPDPMAVEEEQNE